MLPTWLLTVVSAGFEVQRRLVAVRVKSRGRSLLTTNLGSHTIRTEAGSMTLELINPAELPIPPTYTHVIVTTGSRLVFVAGQEPEDSEGNVVGIGDLAAQARQVFANLGRALAAAGARTDQVAKITIYVVHHRREYLPVIEDARVSLFGDHKPVDTLVGVESLARPEYLIEVDAIAVTGD
jgi:enamine deaminase RidA (YjgF/YER057c/UK114 family)